MDPLLSSLAELGCEVRCEGEDGHFPFTLTAHGFGQDHISIDIGHSSQFLSALLIASTLSSEDFMIQVEGTHGMAYIEMTQKMMEQFGVCVERPAADQFRICTGQKYRALDYQIEPDVSAACYFYAMTPLLGIPVCVEHVHFESLQGDVEFLHILEKWAVPHRRRKWGTPAASRRADGYRNAGSCLPWHHRGHVFLLRSGHHSGSYCAFC